MVIFWNWCDQAVEDVGPHALHVLSARPAETPQGRDAIAAIVPAHYAAEERVAGILRRLGKPAAAAFVEDKLPTTKSMRSGDLGEVLATEYIVTLTPYAVPVKRLRWKDHRNMAMRGDDIIGLIRDPVTSRLRFLKAESKSRAALAAAVVAEAREALEKDGGLPSPHALAFISDRLMEMEEEELANAIDDALLKHGIAPNTVRHLLFTFSGNDPSDHLRASLQAYAGPIGQNGVGVCVTGHVDFVANVYDRVIANANNG